MVSFMFTVLGSTLFWIGFFVTGFIIGSMVIKVFAKKTWHFILTGECLARRDSILSNPVDMYFIAFLFMLFWPVVLIFVTIGFFMKRILWPLLRSGIKASGSILPEFEIKQHKDT